MRKKRKAKSGLNPASRLPPPHTHTDCSTLRPLPFRAEALPLLEAAGRRCTAAAADDDDAADDGLDRMTGWFDTRPEDPSMAYSSCTALLALACTLLHACVDDRMDAGTSRRSGADCGPDGACASGGGRCRVPDRGVLSPRPETE